MTATVPDPGYLTPGQVEQLLRPINAKRVAVLDGMSHLEAYDVRAHLNRVFGFARWSEELVEMVELFAIETTTKAGKPAVNVGYRATVRLTVCAPDGTTLAVYTEAAAGDSTMPTFKRGDAYDMAMKTAESQALKRCATNLGDQFGLSLYRKGSTDALVMGTLVGMPAGAPEAGGEAVDAHAPEVVPQAPPPEDRPAERTADPRAEADAWMAVNSEPPTQVMPAPPARHVEGISAAQLKRLNAGLTSLGYRQRPAIYALLSEQLSRPITSSRDLTRAQATMLIDKIQRGEVPSPQSQLPDDTFVQEPPADWRPEPAEAGAR